MTLNVDVAKILKSYQKSLFSYEWMEPDGTVKSFDVLKPSFRAQYSSVLAAWEEKAALPQPILGIGMLGNVEMGGGRDVFLTLAAGGVKIIPVHVPVQMRDEFKSYLAAGDAKSSSQRGSVVAYLLILLVMIAALGYAVTRTTRSSTTSALSNAQSSAYASEILTWAVTVRDTVAKLQYRGCTDTQISFANSVVAGYSIAMSPSDESCHVFSTSGGALTWMTPPAFVNDATPWFYTGAAVVHNTSGYNSTLVAANADLVMMLFGVTDDICTKINESLGVTGIPINDGAYASTTKFQGTYTAAEDINGLSDAAQPSPCSANPDPATNFCGRDAGCFREESGSLRNIFYQTLLSR